MIVCPGGERTGRTTEHAFHVLRRPLACTARSPGRCQSATPASVFWPVPMADTFTTLPTPAAHAAASIASSCSTSRGPGALSRKSASALSAARAREPGSPKSPRTTSTPGCGVIAAGSLVIARTRSPMAASNRTVSLPMVPVAPVTRIMVTTMAAQVP
nr:hypothetical protein [Microbispora sp. GKU 823]